MPYFVEKLDGSFELAEGELNIEELGQDIVAAYTVAEKFSRAMTFKGESLIKKPERRHRCADGSLKFRSEMTEEDIAFLNAKMEKARKARKKAE